MFDKTYFLFKTTKVYYFFELCNISPYFFAKYGENQLKRD